MVKQWEKDKRQWAPGKMQEISFKHKKRVLCFIFLPGGLLNTGTGCPENVESPSLDIFKTPTGHRPLQCS